MSNKGEFRRVVVNAESNAKKIEQHNLFRTVVATTRKRSEVESINGGGIIFVSSATI